MTRSTAFKMSLSASGARQITSSRATHKPDRDASGLCGRPFGCVRSDDAPEDDALARDQNAQESIARTASEQMPARATARVLPHPPLDGSNTAPRCDRLRVPNRLAVRGPHRRPATHFFGGDCGGSGQDKTTHAIQAETVHQSHPPLLGLLRWRAVSRLRHYNTRRGPQSFSSSRGGSKFSAQALSAS